MRISDWSSDVCSSDLLATHRWLLQSKRADDAGHHAVHQLPSMYVVGGASTTPVALDSFVLEQMAKVDATIPTISADWISDSVKDGRRLPFEPYQVAKIGRASCRERVCKYV